MSAPERILMQSKFPEIRKMKHKELQDEVQMWRNVWGWIPSDIKYYTSRTGSTIGVQIRNYHRYLGVLLETIWELQGLELGVYEKVYDQNDGQYYFERKIVKIPVGQIVAFDWIKERINEKEILAEGEAPPDLNIEPTKQYDSNAPEGESVEQ